jgi:hypothetical protein
MRRREHSGRLWRIVVLDLWLAHLRAGRLRGATGELTAVAVGAA